MPNYTYRCSDGHTLETFLPVSLHVSEMVCQQCGQIAFQVICAPLLVKVCQDVSYDSPIDGRPITNWQARQEDLKRSGCRPYDPEMKKDSANFRKQQATELDSAIDAHVEQAIEKMPTAKRGKLMSELTEQGLGADVVRS